MAEQVLKVLGDHVNNRRIVKLKSGGGADDLLIGAVISFASGNIKAGWLPCNGQEVSRSQYPKLFAMIGTTYGVPSNGGVFKLPNLNGNAYFVRGGYSVGTTQGDAIRASYGGTFWGSWNHEGGTGPFRMGGKGPNRRDPYGDQGGFDAKYTFDFANGGPVADEVRPKNMTLYYCIYAGTN